MASDRLLSELQRQQKYLAQLPPNYSFPLFNAKRALESQRSSGYRNTAAASREIIDNAIEAGADRVDVIFDIERESGRRLVKAIAFIDNGSGMLPLMARYALSWGGGTHFEESEFIGRFGFGLPNASINQTRRVEVYTRTASNQRFTKAWLDVNDFPNYGNQSISDPVPSSLPDFVQRYLEKSNFVLDHGTVVVWRDPDRLTYKSAANLKEHLVDDFGITYRYLLWNPTEATWGKARTPLKLTVESVRVDPVDPLFLLPGARYYPKDVQDNKTVAHLIKEVFIPVKYFTDPLTKERHLTALQSVEELDPHDENLITYGSIQVRVARIPVGFAEEKRGRKQSEKTEANYRFDIRKTHRGMSFVRARREIQTIDAFPRSARDQASGLGYWPLLQSYAYYWGAEVRFEPSLDEVFGITNDKQSVRPIEDFWRILADKDIDAILRRENQWQYEQRERKPPAPRSKDRPSPAEQAAQTADATEGARPRVPTNKLEEAKRQLDFEAQFLAEKTNKSIEEAREALEKEARNWQYLVDFFDSEDGPFYKPEWVGDRLVVRVNQKHPFFNVLYKSLLKLPGGSQAKEAVDLLLITLGRAELIADEELTLWYETQRKRNWSPFLDSTLKILDQRLRRTEEASAEEAAQTDEVTIETY